MKDQYSYSPISKLNLPQLIISPLPAEFIRKKNRWNTRFYLFSDGYCNYQCGLIFKKRYKILFEIIFVSHQNNSASEVLKDPLEHIHMGQISVQQGSPQKSCCKFWWMILRRCTGCWARTLYMAQCKMRNNRNIRGKLGQYHAWRCPGYLRRHVINQVR